MTTALATMEDMGKMAAAMVKSKMFGFKTAEEAMSIMLIAQAEGRPAALAARDYHVIQGRPALKADAMLARFQQEGGVVEWDEYTETKVTGRFSHAKSCPKPVSITWTLDMAKKIGLANRDNWRNYTRAMLRARVISEGVRTVYPGIAVGIYTVEEVTDMQKEKDITPTAGAGNALSDEQRTKVDECVAKVREWLLQGSLTDAYMEMDNAALDVDEKIYFWVQFDSRIRRQLTEEGERQRIKARPLLENKPISDAQRKRLEAMIAERGFDRNTIKANVFLRYHKEHFADLNAAEYDEVCSEIESTTADGMEGRLGDGEPNPSRDASPTATPTERDYRKEIKQALEFASESLRARFDLKLKGRAVDDLSDSAAAAALGFLNGELDK